MNHIHAFVLVSVLAMIGCASKDPTTSQGEGEFRSTQIVDEASGEGANNCPSRTRNLLETCSSDCDCVEGLRCSPCVNTEETNCVVYCKAQDPFCHNGFATCPIGAGLECTAVRLCQ